MFLKKYKYWYIELSIQYIKLYNIIINIKILNNYRDSLILYAPHDKDKTLLLVFCNNFTKLDRNDIDLSPSSEITILEYHIY